MTLPRSMILKWLKTKDGSPQWLLVTFQKNHLRWVLVPFGLTKVTGKTAPFWKTGKRDAKTQWCFYLFDFVPGVEKQSSFLNKNEMRQLTPILTIFCESFCWFRTTFLMIFCWFVGDSLNLCEFTPDLGGFSNFKYTFSTHEFLLLDLDLWRCYGLHHGKSPWNHHLGIFVFNFLCFSFCWYGYLINILKQI